jgi:hypothetical protein
LEPWPEIKDIRLTDLDPLIHDNPGKRRLVPEIAVQGHDPKRKLLAKRCHQVRDAADGAAGLVAGEVSPNKHQNATSGWVFRWRGDGVSLD